MESSASIADLHLKMQRREFYTRLLGFLGTSLGGAQAKPAATP